MNRIKDIYINGCLSYWNAVKMLTDIGYTQDNARSTIAVWDTMLGFNCLDGKGILNANGTMKR